jgi:Tfp pilus tip-associated adhesin PilY1
MNPLCTLERHGPVLTTAGIDLEGVLVAEYVDLDTGPCAAEASNRSFAVAPVVGCDTVGEVTSIVAGTVETAVSEEIWVAEIGSNLFRGGPEVVE